MKVRYKVLTASATSCVIILFVAWAYGTAYMGCPEGLQIDLTCSFHEYYDVGAIPLVYEMVFHADDFDGVKEAVLFLEKYPESEIFYEMVGYGYHFKHYLYTVEDTDEKVYLMMTKNTAIGEFDNVISCPPNQYHDVGYAVRGSDNVVRYLENHDCFSDVAEEYFDYDLSRWITGPVT